MVKLPWTEAHRAQAKLWAERYFIEVPSELAGRVAVILAERIGCSFDELEPHRRLDSYADFTELTRVELVMALESELGITISDKDAEAMTTPARIVTGLAGRPSQK